MCYDEGSSHLINGSCFYHYKTNIKLMSIYCLSLHVTSFEKCLLAQHTCTPCILQNTRYLLFLEPSPRLEIPILLTEPRATCSLLYSGPLSYFTDSVIARSLWL